MRPRNTHAARAKLQFTSHEKTPIQATKSSAQAPGNCANTAGSDRLRNWVAADLLHDIGLPELVTHTLADYKALALKLASTPALLAGLKSRLAANRLTQPLFDTERFSQHTESAYLTMYQLSQQGLPPAGVMGSGLVFTHCRQILTPPVDSLMAARPCVNTRPDPMFPSFQLSLRT